jgi:L-histidine N-alpha-methyltransferase
MSLHALQRSGTGRFTITTHATISRTFAEDVAEGLSRKQKTLPPKWFYDALGSTLFDAICHLEEYYLTRAEDEILARDAAAIVEACGSHLRLVELGAGSAQKTRHLMRAALAIQPSLEYVPVDVDEHSLGTTASKLLDEFPAMQVRAISGDFTEPSLLHGVSTPGTTTLVAFLGSTIGNLDRMEATKMLSRLRSTLQPGDALLLGVDLVKDVRVLEAAYDDPTGVTAAFNLNVLGRINRELGGDFDMRAFRHRALYDTEHDRIEMHLVSQSRQTVRIAATEQSIEFDAGETIHTENSYKYTPQAIDELAASAGFRVERMWRDSNGRFADVLMR